MFELDVTSIKCCCCATAAPRLCTGRRSLPLFQNFALPAFLGQTTQQYLEFECERPADCSCLFFETRCNAIPRHKRKKTFEDLPTKESAVRFDLN